MNLVNTGIRDLLILEPKVFTDSRGYFFESYNKNTLGDFIGKKYNFVQENEFKSSYGVIRWLHYQLAPYSQVKFVRERMGYASGRAPDVIKLSRTWMIIGLSEFPGFLEFMEKNFVETMLRLSKEITTVKVVNDQFGKPTYTVDLANKIKEIIELDSGIYHITDFPQMYTKMIPIFSIGQ